MKQQLYVIDDRFEALQFLMSQNEGNKSIHFQFIRLNDSKKVRNNAKINLLKIKYDARKANMEKHFKQRAEKHITICTTTPTTTKK
jgi:hypothetical protein